MCNERGVNPWIEVDGGVTPANAYKVIEAGANALVAGSAVYGSKDYAAGAIPAGHSTPAAPALPLTATTVPKQTTKQRRERLCDIAFLMCVLTDDFFSAFLSCSHQGDQE